MAFKINLTEDRSNCIGKSDRTFCKLRNQTRAYLSFNADSSLKLTKFFRFHEVFERFPCLQSFLQISDFFQLFLSHVGEIAESLSTEGDSNLKSPDF